MITGRLLMGAARLAALLMGVWGTQALADAGRSGPPLTQWPNVNGNSNETGFSSLAQITPANAAQLGLQWYLDLPGESGLEAAPVVVDGVLYFTGSYASVYAVDGASGKLLWRYDPRTWEHNPNKMHFSLEVNRGVAYADGRIFVGALDGRLIALDAKSGRLLWQSETTDPKGGQTITGAPRAFAGKVVIGQGGADFGMRGYVTAYDQQTGKLLWRFYVVPGSPQQNAGDPAMEAAAKTWSGDHWKKSGGGGGPWDSMTYDAELGRLYVGTGNAFAYNPDDRSPGGGDNLYTASIVALDASTGKYLWHYQVNPRDAWDFDATQQMALATLTIGGRAHRVLMQAPKNGFFYVIDRDTGKLLSAGKLGRATWAERIDIDTGRPVEVANVRYDRGAFAMFPSTLGAHSWMRMSYSPHTGLVYVPFINLGTRFHRGVPDAGDFALGGVDMAYDTTGPGPKGALIAWDPITQKQSWQVPFSTYWNGGTLATAGNVVFMGGGDGWFNAFDGSTGTRLWHSFASMGIMAAPTSYSIGARQYVSVLTGYGGTAGSAPSDIMNVGWKYSGPRRLLTFALGGQQALPVSAPPTSVVHARDDPAEVLDPKGVQTGKALFMACFSCHGHNLVSAGTAPDLRESPVPLDTDAFQQVVRGGALMEHGMPRFDSFTPEQVEAIRQYIRSGARAAIREGDATKARSDGERRH